MTTDKTTEPERTYVTWPGKGCGLAFSEPADTRTEYIRSDLCASGQVRAVEMLGELLAYEEWQAHVGGVVPDRFIGVINRALEAYRAALTPAPQHEGRVRAVMDAADRDADRCAERIMELEAALEKARAALTSGGRG